MNFPLVNALLSLFVVSHLRLTEVVAKSIQQDQETGVVVDRDNGLGNNELAILRDLQTASSGTGRGWYDKVRRWTDEDELLAGMKTGELRQERSSRKRGFDSLGGGLIPTKRQHYSRTSRFDSLGGGIIPTRKRWQTAAQESLEDLAIGFKRRRRFDSLGGGHIPDKRPFDSLGGGVIPTKKH